MSEQVYILGRGPRHHKPVRFGVSQAARTLRFQLNDGVLRWKLRWPLVFMVFSHCLWVWKGRTDVSEQVYGLGRGPQHQKPVQFQVCVPGCWIAQISAEQWGALTGDEVAIGVHGVFPLPMGIERGDRHE